MKNTFKALIFLIFSLTCQATFTAEEKFTIANKYNAYITTKNKGNSFINYTINISDEEVPILFSILKQDEVQAAIKNHAEEVASKYSSDETFVSYRKYLQFSAYHILKEHIIENTSILGEEIDNITKENGKVESIFNLSNAITDQIDKKGKIKEPDNTQQYIPKQMAQAKY
jgi:hypothetical protein